MVLITIEEGIKQDEDKKFHLNKMLAIGNLPNLCLTGVVRWKYD